MDVHQCVYVPFLFSCVVHDVIFMQISERAQGTPIH